jgi:hypothetical protein
MFFAVSAFFAFFGVVPGWYQPAVTTVGVVGLALTIGSFLAVHEDRLPWLLLWAATATLGVDAVLILSA